MSFESIENMDGKILLVWFLEMVKTTQQQPNLIHNNKEFYTKYQHYYNELLNRLEK